MTEASVGFQCPECVAEGRTTVRQPTTRAGGTITADTGRLTLLFIMVNVVVQGVVMVTGGTSGELFQNGAMWGGGIALGNEYWRLLTAAFLHGSLIHLAFNMFALYLFGPYIEQTLGRTRFIATYLTLAAASSAFVYWLTAPNVLTIGASGVVFGMFGLALIFMIRTKQNFTGMLVLLAINGVISLQSGISWQGHLGGFLTGLTLGAVFAWAPRKNRTGWQIAAFVAVWLLIVLAVATRSAYLLSGF